MGVVAWTYPEAVEVAAMVLFISVWGVRAPKGRETMLWLLKCAAMGWWIMQLGAWVMGVTIWRYSIALIGWDRCGFMPVLNGNRPEVLEVVVKVACWACCHGSPDIAWLAI